MMIGKNLNKAYKSKHDKKNIFFISINGVYY